MKHLLSKLRQNAAQHTVEYMTVIILIMAGIIIGGPYVIRSWNAQMKSWDDSVIDSFRDPLTDTPPVSIPGCDPTSLVSAGCGASAEPCPGMITTCGPYQRISQQNYSPAGCECAMIPVPTTVWCTDDPSCCSAWTNIACGVNASPPCPDGEMRQNRTCDVTGFETRCVSDASCVYGCLPCLPGPKPACTIPPPNSTACPGTTTGLTGDTNWSTTTACSGAKCQALCDSGFLPQ